MKWSDLKLTNEERSVLGKYAINDPEAVVSLTSGAPELAERVLSKPTIERLRREFPVAEPSEQSFALGAQLGQRSKPVETPPDFESRRANLIDRLSKAGSDAARGRIERDLRKLYSNG